MAVKKPVKKRDATSPNTVLVLFLVFFVLLSIGLGVWGYYGYAGQKNLKEEAVKALDKEKVANIGKSYFQMLNREFLYAHGHALDADELKLRDAAREDIDKNLEKMLKAEKDAKIDYEGEFRTEVTLPAMLKIINEDTLLLGYDSKTKRFAGSFRDRLQDLSGKNTKLLGDLETQQKKAKEADDKYLALAPKIDKYWEKALQDIQTGNAGALKSASMQPERMDAALKFIKDLQGKLEKTEEELGQKITKLEAERKQLNDRIAELKDKVATGSPAAIAAAKAMTDPHALFLDITTMKPLWDEPLGKIIRVDLREQQVYINLGSSKGVKPQLTFNIFAPGWYGRAEKGMKGSIEVLRVLDANSSLARITSLYDVDGYEIPLNDPNIVRKLADNPIKEGDLLFNMAWGTHIVIAGPINWTGLPGDSGNDQSRHMQAFIALMERMGVIVDAYLDLNDGRLRGTITSKTKYMVRGDNLPVDKDGQPEANKKINEAIQAVRKEAVERGMFIISADNFAMVAGYRRPRSAAEAEASTFRPGVPYAGLSAAPPMADQPPMENK